MCENSRRLQGWMGTGRVESRVGNLSRRCCAQIPNPTQTAKSWQATGWGARESDTMGKRQDVSMNVFGSKQQTAFQKVPGTIKTWLSHVEEAVNPVVELGTGASL